jgi:hypothetical protein
MRPRCVGKDWSASLSPALDRAACHRRQQERKHSRSQDKRHCVFYHLSVCNSQKCTKCLRLTHQFLLLFMLNGPGTPYQGPTHKSNCNTGTPDEQKLRNFGVSPYSIQEPPPTTPICQPSKFESGLSRSGPLRRWAVLIQTDAPHPNIHRESNRL